LAVVAALAMLATPATPATDQRLPDAVLYQSSDIYTTPAGVTCLKISVWGGHGAASADGQPGGEAGRIEAYFSTNPGDMFAVNVSKNGMFALDPGSPGGGSSEYDGGGGGGWSDVFGYLSSNPTRLILAGGGGGGGDNTKGGDGAVGLANGSAAASGGAGGVFGQPVGAGGNAIPIFKYGPVFSAGGGGGGAGPGGGGNSADGSGGGGGANFVAANALHVGDPLRTPGNQVIMTPSPPGLCEAPAATGPSASPQPAAPSAVAATSLMATPTFTG
jgi:hypothetical protein